MSLILLFVSVFEVWAQRTTIRSQSFENGEAVNYTSNTFDLRGTGVTLANNQYFTITTTNPPQNPSDASNYAFGASTDPIAIKNSAGTANYPGRFWIAEGVRCTSNTGATCGRDPGNVTLTSFDARGYDNIEVTVSLADPRGPGSFTNTGNPTTPSGGSFNAADKIEIQYSTDGGANYTTIGRFSGNNNNGSTGFMELDEDLDTDVNDQVKATLNYRMTDYTFGNSAFATIPSSPASLMVRVVIDERGSSEELAFDNIRVTGIPTSVQPPTLSDAQTGTINYNEGDPSTQVTSTIAAGSATGITGATVTIVSNVLSSDDELTFTPIANVISGTYANGVLSLTGNATAAQYQTVLQSVRYRNSNSATARGGNRAIQFVVRNGTSTSSTVTRNVLVKALLSGPATLPYTQDFTSDEEGTRYSSNTFIGSNGFAFTRTNVTPSPLNTGGITFTNISNGFYWYGVNVNAVLQNPERVGRLETQQVDATNFGNLRFSIRLGASSGSGARWQNTDSFKMYYRTGGSSGTWKLFGSFRGNTTSTNGTGDLKQDRPEDLANLPTLPAGTATVTPALTNFDFTLPADANRQLVDFKLELIADDGAAEFAFDLIRVTGDQLPTVTTSAATTITNNSAILGGTVNGNGTTVTERGVVYSSSDNTPTIGEAGVVQDTNPSTTSPFSENIMGLTAATTYYVRAYAINAAGTSYGATETFTTSTTVASIVRAGTTNPTNASQVSFTVTFATPVTGLTTGNFSLTTTGTLSGASVVSVSGSGTTYTVVVNTGSNSGTLRLNLDSSTGLTPTVGNLPFTGGEAYDIDKTRPSVAISSTAGVAGGTTATSPIPFTVTFSENVTGFVAGDVTVINGSITGGTVTGTSPGAVYTFTVTPATAGTATTVAVPANVAVDAAGNFNTAAPSNYSLTYQQPTATVTSVTRLDLSPTAVPQVFYQVVFSGNVTGLTVSNFRATVTSGTITGTGINSVVGSGTTYRVGVNTGTGDGTLRLDVQNSTGTTPTITSVPYTSGETYTITKSFAAAPTLRIQAAGSASGNGDITAFVDAVQVLSGGATFANGLQNGSFETNNVAPGTFKKTADGVIATPWSFTGLSGVSRNGSAFGSTAADGDAVALVQSNPDNNASISQNLGVPTGSYQVRFRTIQRNYTSLDQRLNVFVNDVFVGNIQPNNIPTYDTFTSASFSVTAPALTATVSSSAAATGSTTTTSPIPFSVSFSASVGTSFTDADVTVTDGTVTTGSFSGSGAGPYTFTVTPTTPGTATTVSLVAGVAQDANNTPNSASNAYSVTYNQPQTAAPTVTIPSNGATTNSTPTSLGSAVVGSTVRVYIDGVQVGAAVTPNSGGTWIRTYSGLPPLTSGTHTVYATAQLPGQLVSAPSPTNTFTVQVPATYSSSAATQASTARVVAGSTNQAILQVAIVIGGGPDAPISATSFTFTTTGSTSPADIAAARVYYTGTSNTFAATNQFGSATASPNGSFTIGGNRQLVNGTNYFWLVYDVAPGATIGNVLDATAPSFTLFDGSFPSTRNPSTPDPAGNRQIVRISRVAGTALRFTGDATSGYVDFSASTTPAPLLNTGTNGAYTQVAWIKPAIGTGSTNYYVLGNGTSNSAAPYIYVTGNGRLGAGFGTGTATVSRQTGPNTVSANEWHHVAATYTGSSLTLYLDGVALSSGGASGTPAATRVNYIGNVAASGSNNFPGDIDEVSQWNQALNATELRQLRHLTLSGTETGLVSYAQFNDAGTTTTDGISGAVGTLTGATRVTSTAPVGAGVSNLQSVTGTGNYSFSGTNVAINFTAVAGAPYDVVVARLEGTPLGTPVSDPNLRSTHTRAYWIVDKYNDNTFTAAVTYTLDPGLISAGDAATPSNLKLYKRGSNSDGAFDAPISATAANAAASTVTFPVNSFSQTFIGTYGSSPLPVKLVRFTAERKGNDALLQWATAQELNNAYFEVESSVDGRTFRAIGRVTGHGTSTQAQEYKLTDANLARYARSVVYYRLRQVDLDGTSSLSAVQTVQVPGVTSSLTALVFPNPAADQLTVRLSGPYGKAQGWLFDAQGRTVQELSRPLAAAVGSDIHLSVANLPTGVYTLRLVLDGQVLHQQIVVQR
ncbi:LamG-like jellyroll fold domain-containing protein [Hymenobacter swuensis]|uniref:LamG-like jellyroll fold domain-containing protein n=1 Tax=Hymenobacter swuensis TaxID=1446467 RepID=UPI0012DE7803|nr:LamG-like jellyroll fold domain-containing protein [Hymenobacter swuensis]